MYTYHGSKIKHFGKFGHNFPLESCVKDCALIEISSIDKYDVIILSFQVIHFFLEPGHSSKTFFLSCKKLQNYLTYVLSISSADLFMTKFDRLRFSITTIIQSKIQLLIVNIQFISYEFPDVF